MNSAQWSSYEADISQCKHTAGHNISPLIYEASSAVLWLLLEFRYPPVNPSSLCYGAFSLTAVNPYAFIAILLNLDQLYWKRTSTSVCFHPLQCSYTEPDVQQQEQGQQSGEKTQTLKRLDPGKGSKWVWRLSLTWDVFNTTRWQKEAEAFKFFLNSTSKKSILSLTFKEMS